MAAQHKDAGTSSARVPALASSRLTAGRWRAGPAMAFDWGEDQAELPPANPAPPDGAGAARMGVTPEGH